MSRGKNKLTQYRVDWRVADHTLVTDYVELVVVVGSCAAQRASQTRAEHAQRTTVLGVRKDEGGKVKD